MILFCCIVVEPSGCCGVWVRVASDLLFRYDAKLLLSLALPYESSTSSSFLLTALLYSEPSGIDFMLS